MTVFKGKAWKFDDDIDTDQIYPGKYLPLTDKVEMGKVAMSGVEGFEDFSERVGKGDVLLAGKNFGCGSSREHAVVTLEYAGVSVVVAKSPCGFRAVYEQHANAIFCVRAPGCAPSDFWNYSFEDRPMPLWPWEEITSWTAEPRILPLDR